MGIRIAQQSETKAIIIVCVSNVAKTYPFLSTKGESTFSHLWNSPVDSLLVGILSKPL